MKLFLMLFLLSPCAFAENVHLPTIAIIESGGNPRAIGDGGRALGRFQLHKGVVEDYNRRHNTRISHKMAYDSEVSRRVADWYLNREIPRLLRHFRLPDTVQNRLWAYNAGIKSVLKGRMPSVTKMYLKKYFRILK